MIRNHKNKSKQLTLLKKERSAYGGELLKTRKGRSRPRTLDAKNTMHLVLRSSKAKGDWSFKKAKNEKKIQEIIKKFSHKYGVKIISLANVGNHLHFHIKLSSRYTYKPFIRAVTSAIAMAITGVNRWSKIKTAVNGKKKTKEKFWDYRPFTRVIESFKALLNLNDYIQINRLEGFGYDRTQARFILARDWDFRAHHSTG